MSSHSAIKLLWFIRLKNALFKSHLLTELGTSVCFEEIAYTFGAEVCPPIFPELPGMDGWISDEDPTFSSHSLKVTDHKLFLRLDPCVVAECLHCSTYRICGNSYGSFVVIELLVLPFNIWLHRVPL